MDFNIIWAVRKHQSTSDVGGNQNAIDVSCSCRTVMPANRTIGLVLIRSRPTHTEIEDKFQLFDPVRIWQHGPGNEQTPRVGRRSAVGGPIDAEAKRERVDQSRR